MPLNKKAIVRYQVIDEMLSDKHHYYSTQDICDRCNRILPEFGDKKDYETVTIRTIQSDLKALPSLFPDIEIIHTTDPAGRRIVRYEDQSVSIFAKKLTDDEKSLLKEVLNTLGQFSGLDNFEWLESLQARLNDRKSFNDKLCNAEDDDRKIILFSNNEYLRNKEHLGWFFSAIKNRKVVRIEYRRFGQNASKHFTVYPYFLKQYNDRWYLICNHVGDEEHPYRPEHIENLALDRIESYDYAEGLEYKDCPLDVEERFMDIVGVTYLDERPLTRITFCVSRELAPYIETKPIHNSQRRIAGDNLASLKKAYPDFVDYIFYDIECIPDDYELPRLLRSFGSKLIVLSPDEIRNQVIEELREQLGNYE